MGGGFGAGEEEPCPYEVAGPWQLNRPIPARKLHGVQLHELLSRHRHLKTTADAVSTTTAASAALLDNLVGLGAPPQLQHGDGVEQAGPE